jgi:hyperosmotically inducible periplasmic protein
MRTLMLGMLCGLSIGCNESRGPNGQVGTTTETPTSITTNRPITSDQQTVGGEMGNRTNADGANANRTSADGSQLDHDSAGRTNTGINVRDRDGAAKTSFDQNENNGDIAITADIRKQIVATEMSTNAHNVKIMTQNGKVTLRGPVTTAEEKQQVENIALGVAGAGNLDSQLEVDRN